VAKNATVRDTGSKREIASMAPWASCSTGRVAATVMITNTNAGSVKLMCTACSAPAGTKCPSMNSTVAWVPARIAIPEMNTPAHRPNTLSTSASRRIVLSPMEPSRKGWAQWWNRLTENVCTMARANSAVARISS
jgi:hypothetical protein